MFTGIITDKGTITKMSRNGDMRISVATSYDMQTVDIGASIACCGVCLTVIEKGEGYFVAEVSDETLSCTTADKWQVGTELNLERALKIGDEFGGHIVSGHVDGMASVISVTKIKDSHEIIFEAPDNLKYFIAAKGSVTLDGISLTVNKVNDRQFTVNIIPHTWQKTTFCHLKEGSIVNLEIDTLARYVARLREAV